MSIKPEENVKENPSHCVPFSLETGKLKILKDCLFPHGLVSRVFTFFFFEVFLGFAI